MTRRLGLGAVLPIVLLLAWLVAVQASYHLGVGKADITGPAAEVVMMGYADSKQVSAGLLNRQYARAFVIHDPAANTRVLLVNCDALAIFQLVHQEVLRQLAVKYPGLYTEQNVVLHASHTHATPGGSSAYFMYDVSILGYIDETFQALVHGILEAVDHAHASIAPGSLRFNKGRVDRGGRNRSPAAYANNPATERAQYADDRDDELRMLHFMDASGGLRGLWAMFPVHPTSLTQHNRLISGDNKGFAMWQVESHYKNQVVAALGISNAGDVSPNRIDNGDGTFRGEGRTDVESAEIMGARQAQTMLDLVGRPSDAVAGSVAAKLAYVDFSNVTLAGVKPTPDAPYGHRTCPAVIGQNFGAGTEDGRGLSVFSEGELKANPLFQAVSFVIKPTPAWLQACHLKQKVPLLASGLISPVPWSPEVLPVQVIKIGQFALAALPFEITTMAGRRLRKSLQTALGAAVTDVDVAAVSNAYAQYMTTKEEYVMQHYEGASTHFGPNQLAAAQQEVARVAASVLDPSIPLDVGPRPRTFDRSKLITLQTGVVMDDHPIGASFGDVRAGPKASYAFDNSTVTVSFVGGHPKNLFEQVDSFCDVEKLNAATGKFATYLTDSHWDVRFRWARAAVAESKSECEWVLRAGSPTSVPGTYRLRHRGFWKPLIGSIERYEGVSAPFTVA